jgi:hypothetical protein
VLDAPPDRRSDRPREDHERTVDEQHGCDWSVSHERERNQERGSDSGEAQRYSQLQLRGCGERKRDDGQERRSREGHCVAHAGAHIHTGKEQRGYANAARCQAEPERKPK